MNGRIAALWSTLIIAAMWSAVGAQAHAEKPLYAKHATAFDPECEFETGGIYPTVSHCQPITVPSPNGERQIQIVYGKPVNVDGDRARIAHLEIKTRIGTTQLLRLPEGFEPIDLQWSPDSRAFFLNGGNGGAYWGFWTWAYFLGSGGRFEKVNVMRVVAHNMDESFPPCKASGIDSAVCNKAFKPEADHSSDYNISGIGWSSDPPGLVVMAEVPCSSSEGGIMCQVKGYVVSLPGGRILKQMSGQELKQQWQGSMAFDLRIPPPPQYGPTAQKP